MRRMSLVTRASWLCLLGLALSAGAAQAQGPPVLVVYTNKTESVGMSKNQPIATVQSSDAKIIRVQPVQNDPTKVLVTGLMPGRSRLTFEDKNKQTEIIDVEVVDANLEQLRKEFLEQMAQRVPGSQLTVQTTAGGVIVGGTVSDQTSLRAVQDAAKNFFGERVTFAMQLPEAVKDRFMAQVQRAIPGSKVNVHIDGGNIIVSGYAPDATSVKAIEQSARNTFGPDTVMAISVAGSEPSARIPRVQQVELEVIVAVVNRSEARNLSFNFIINGEDYFFASIINTPLSFANSIFAGASGASQTATAGGSTLSFGVVGDKNSFTGFLNALRTEGLAKILAEPRIVTLSGQSAKILSGGETPVLTTSGQGSPTIEYKPFGTEVNFTPVVLENGRIQLQVVAQLSNRNDANGIFIGGATPTQIPGFDTREVRSVIQLEDCQTIAIGGLIQNTVNASVAKIPVLGDIPFFGTAFSSSNYRVVEEEMLILVTPRLIEPMNCCQLPKFLPGRETRVADDFELFLTQILEAPRGQRDVCPDGKFVAAHRNGPTAGLYPCGDNTQGWGGHGRGGCGHAGCGAGGCRLGHGLGLGGHGCRGCASGSCNTHAPATAPAHTPTTQLPSGVAPAGYDMPLPQGPATEQGAMHIPTQDVPVLPIGEINQPVNYPGLPTSGY